MNKKRLISALLVCCASVLSAKADLSGIIENQTNGAAINVDSGIINVNNNTIIQNKAFHFRSELDNRITNSGYFRLFRYGDAQVICGNEYVKVGCITLTYLQAYNALTGGNDILDKWLKEHYSSTRMWKDHREELIYECEKELKRLGIKYKGEDN